MKEVSRNVDINEELKAASPPVQTYKGGHRAGTAKRAELVAAEVGVLEVSVRVLSVPGRNYNPALTGYIEGFFGCPERSVAEQAALLADG